MSIGIKNLLKIAGVAVVTGAAVTGAVMALTHKEKVEFDSANDIFEEVKNDLEQGNLNDKSFNEAYNELKEASESHNQAITKTKNGVVAGSVIGLVAGLVLAGVHYSVKKDQGKDKLVAFETSIRESLTHPEEFFMFTDMNNGVHFHSNNEDLDTIAAIFKSRLGVEVK
jgi:hypothetical protein